MQKYSSVFNGISESGMKILDNMRERYNTQGNHNGSNSIAPKKSKLKNEYEDEDIRLWHEYKAGGPTAKQAQWQLLDRFKGLHKQNAIKQSNVLPKAVVEAKLKMYTLNAFNTYDPTQGTKLSTHVQNYMKKINRDNYTYQQAIRLPENVAIGYTRYMDGKAKLEESLDRDPTTAELAEHLGWSVDATANAAKKYHKELVESKLTFDPGIHESDAMGSAIRFVYNEMTDNERYLFEHKTGYLNSKIYPMAKIKDDLKMTPHQFNQLQLKLTEKLHKAVTVLEKD